jgi:hypothetical protein
MANLFWSGLTGRAWKGGWNIFLVPVACPLFLCYSGEQLADSVSRLTLFN